ncbi:MAG: Flp pilus assembly protein CpaB [Acidimicrobiia bacterium]
MSTIALARRRVSLWGVATILASIVTGLAVYSYLSWLRAQIPVAGKLVVVVTAAQDLEPGTTIEAGMFELAKHPDRYLPQDALRTSAAVIGKVVAVPVFSGEIITERKIGKIGGFSSVVPKGLRAYSIVVSSGVGFLPQKGDRVDVIATFPREVTGEPSTVTILRYKEVAAVAGGSNVDQEKLAQRIGLEAGAQGGIGLTLYVTPEEAQRLAMAESLGRITVVLAPAAAEEGGDPEPVKASNLAR